MSCIMLYIYRFGYITHCSTEIFNPTCYFCISILIIVFLLIFFQQVPNEIGSLEPLRGYQGEDIEIQLPGKLTVYDIDWLSVWCVEYRHNFGHVYIPKDLDVPPALGQTKITVSHTCFGTIGVIVMFCVRPHPNLVDPNSNPTKTSRDLVNILKTFWNLGHYSKQLL